MIDAFQTPPLPRKSTSCVLLMVSGGSDSMGLLLRGSSGLLMLEHEYVDPSCLQVFHLNHMLRGKQADADEALVASTCKKLNITCHTFRVDVTAATAQVCGNMENVAREIRYKLAFDVLKEHTADVNRARIITAHTADDQIENFFMRALTGTGTGALGGLLPQYGIVSRPLLDVTRADLRQELTCAGWTWHEDVTNTDTTYLRSYVRHNVVPAAVARNPNIYKTLPSTMELLRRDAGALDEIADSAYSKHVAKLWGSGCLVSHALSQEHKAISSRVMLRVLREVGGEDVRIDKLAVDGACALLGAPQGSLRAPGGIDIRADIDGVTVSDSIFKKSSGVSTQKAADGKVADKILKVPGSLELACGGILVASITSGPFNLDMVEPDVPQAFFDLASITSGPYDLAGDKVNLVVNMPFEGERIAPLGMGGSTKLVSDLLQEAKIPRRDRPYVPVVHRESGEAVWVVGVRSSELARCTKDTQQVVELRYLS